MNSELRSSGEPLPLRGDFAGGFGFGSRGGEAAHGVSVVVRTSLVGGAAGALGFPAESACSGDLPGSPRPRGGALPGGRPATTSRYIVHLFTSEERS